MSRNPFAPAVHAVLKEHGFHKVSGVEWQREADGYLDSIDIQSEPLDRTVTANVRVRDVITKSLGRSVVPPDAGGLFYSASSRIGRLMSRYDKWWSRDDPDGPREMAQALMTYGLPFLDGLHSIQAMTERMRRGIEGRRWGDMNDREDLALLLWRQGRQDEACALMQNPPQRIPESWKASIEAIRRFVCETPPPDPPEA